jgi:two-component system, cell cycle response regulator
MKVLIADDEAVSLRFLESSLRRWGYDVVAVSDGLEAMRHLEQPGAPNLVVLDWLMPGLDGAEVCREIRRRNTDHYTYVLLLTTKCAKGDIIQGLESGADDYVSKPFDPQELKVRLRTGERILDLLDQLVAAREAIRDMAMHDSLTGLWNRAGILNILENELVRASRQGTPVGVVLADLDRFKSVNDVYGHLAGDEALRTAARAFQETVRPYDSVGRYGGEEILMVLPGCDAVNAVSHAERLRAALARVVVQTSSGELRMTASFGVTVAEHGASDARSLLEAADTALYCAKRNGRDRVELAGTEEPALATV